MFVIRPSIKDHKGDREFISDYSAQLYARTMSTHDSQGQAIVLDQDRTTVWQNGRLGLVCEFLDTDLSEV